jgi:hypothetical protein
VVSSQRRDRFRVHACRMAENDDVSGIPEDDATTPGDTQRVLPPDTPAPTPQPVLKTRWRDRAWTFRAMLAVALASLVIGGIAGGAIVAAAGGDDDDGYYRMGPGGPGGRMPPGMGPRRFRDGGPQWRWQDGQPPGPELTPYGQQAPPTPTPSPGSTG